MTGSKTGTASCNCITAISSLNNTITLIIVGTSKCPCPKCIPVTVHPDNIHIISSKPITVGTAGEDETTILQLDNTVGNIFATPAKCSCPKCIRVGIKSYNHHLCITRSKHHFVTCHNYPAVSCSSYRIACISCYSTESFLNNRVLTPSNINIQTPANSQQQGEHIFPKLHIHNSPGIFLG